MISWSARGWTLSESLGSFVAFVDVQSTLPLPPPPPPQPAALSPVKSLHLDLGGDARSGCSSIHVVH